MTELLLGRYRVDELLGVGAFATVHRAFDEQLDDPVAVKLLAHNHAADTEMRSRFIAEGQVLRRIGSPHVINVHDLAESEDGRPFLVLELCDRGTLRQRVVQARQGGWTPTSADVLAVAAPLAAAIEAISQADVVHRDLTPSNILLTTGPPRLPSPPPASQIVRAGERLVVTDLGFCKDLARSTGISATGGTEGFQPPEQRSPGGTVDVRSDLWAASAVLTWMLTGAVADTAKEARHAIIAAGIDTEMADAITAGLANDPHDRPDTPQQWLAQLNTAAPQAGPTAAARPATHAGQELVEPSPGGGRRRSVAVAGVLLLMLVAIYLRTGPGEVGSASEELFGDEPTPLATESTTSAAEPMLTPTPSEVPTTEPSPTPSSEATIDPEQYATTYGPEMAGVWSFHLTNHDGWEYDYKVTGGVAMAVEAFTTEQMLPGRAAIRSAARGGLHVEVTETIPDREAPRFRPHSARVLWFGDEPGFNTDQCQRYELVESTPPVSLHCNIALNNTDEFGRWNSFHSPDGSDEAAVQQVVELYADRAPDAVVLIFGLDNCRIILHPDGSVARDMSQSSAQETIACELSGPDTFTYPDQR